MDTALQVRFLQHVPFEGPANVGRWLEEQGHNIETTHWYRDQEPPEDHAPDLLVILGGPMNIYQEDCYPWLAAEKRYLHCMIQQGAGALGICLGAQLLADVLGGSVVSNGEAEIGWYPVHRCGSIPPESPLCVLDDSLMAFHWHGDRFHPPPGSSLAYASDACDAQAFSVGDRIVALQFHLDYSAASIEKMLIHCSEELDDSRWVQSAGRIRAGQSRLAEVYQSLDKLLSALTRNICATGSRT